MRRRSRIEHSLPVAGLRAYLSGINWQHYEIHVNQVVFRDKLIAYYFPVWAMYCADLCFLDLCSSFSSDLESDCSRRMTIF